MADSLRDGDATAHHKQPVLLHVEDNEAEAYLFRNALFEYEIDVAVFRVSDGHAAVEFLTRKGVYEDAPVPDLVVLDLNLPRKERS